MENEKRFNPFIIIVSRYVNEMVFYKKKAYHRYPNEFSAIKTRWICMNFVRKTTTDITIIRFTYTGNVERTDNVGVFYMIVNY